MADEGDRGNEAQDAIEGGKGKGKGKRFLILAVVFTLVVAVGGVGVVIMLTSKDDDGKNGKSSSSHKDTKGSEDDEGDEGEQSGFTASDQFKFLAPFLWVPLADTDTPRSMDFTLTLEFADETKIEEVSSREDKYRDAIITEVMSYRYEDLSTPDGKKTLANQIVRIVNAHLGGHDAVREAYFSQYIVR